MINWARKACASGLIGHPKLFVPMSNKPIVSNGVTAFVVDETGQEISVAPLAASSRI